MDGTSLAVPKSLGDGVAMQNFVNDQFDVMIGVKKSDVFLATTNGTEIILVADEYGNQESNDTTEDDGSDQTAKKCRFLPKSASGDGKMTPRECMKEKAGGDDDMRGLCQMSECYTNDYFRCQFPFRSGRGRH